MTARPRRGALLSAVLLAAVVALVALQATWPRPGEGAPGPAPRAHRALPAAERPATARRSRIALGVTTLAFARNAAVRWRPADLRQVDAFERRARRRTDLVMWFADWAHVRDFDARQAAAVAARGGDARGLLGAVGLRVRAAGPAALPPAAHHRGRLRRLHRALGPRGRRLRAPGAAALRAGDERPLVPVGRARQRQPPRRVRPGLAPRPRDLRPRRRPQRPLGVVPGGRVDPGLAVPGPHARSTSSGWPASTAARRCSGASGGPSAWPSARRWTSCTGSTAHKPIELSEVGSVEQGGSKAAWIHGMFRELRRRPEVRSVVWFNVRKEADWRIESSRSAQRAFAAEVSRAG